MQAVQVEGKHAVGHTRSHQLERVDNGVQAAPSCGVENSHDILLEDFSA
jgi:hypothetical protein